MPKMADVDGGGGWTVAFILSVTTTRAGVGSCAFLIITIMEQFLLARGRGGGESPTQQAGQNLLALQSRRLYCLFPSVTFSFLPAVTMLQSSSTVCNVLT